MSEYEIMLICLGAGAGLLVCCMYKLICKA